MEHIEEIFYNEGLEQTDYLDGCQPVTNDGGTNVNKKGLKSKEERCTNTEVVSKDLKDFDGHTQITFDTMPRAVAWLVTAITELRAEVAALSSQKLPHPRKAWMNAQELSEYLPMHPSLSTIYAWTSTRSIPFHKNGRYTVFYTAEIDRWINDETISSDEELEKKAQYFVKMSAQKRQRRRLQA
jgi:predicted DNA-binding transcriptional regulator AlpA